MSIVYSGKWSVFNDPKFDQRLIPEDEKEKEALRIELLVTDWMAIEIDDKIIFGRQLNADKLLTYYYTEHTNHSVPLHVCQPIQFEGSPMFYYCIDYTKERILRLDTYGTFQYIWRYQRLIYFQHSYSTNYFSYWSFRYGTFYIVIHLRGQHQFWTKTTISVIYDPLKAMGGFFSRIFPLKNLQIL